MSPLHYFVAAEQLRRAEIRMKATDTHVRELTLTLYLGSYRITGEESDQQDLQIRAGLIVRRAKGR